MKKVFIVFSLIIYALVNTQLFAQNSSYIWTSKEDSETDLSGLRYSFKAYSMQQYSSSYNTLLTSWDIVGLNFHDHTEDDLDRQKNSTLPHVNNYLLPSQPDPIENKMTVLGIDKNNNGVRDDIEIWIFQTYTHPIIQAIALQNAKAFQKVLPNPSNAKQTTKFMEDAHDCIEYYQYYADEGLDTMRILNNINLYRESRAKILNTKKRARSYFEYNQALSGGVYPLRPIDTLKSHCDFDASKIEHGEW